jgi:hypothetical protein
MRRLDLDEMSLLAATLLAAASTIADELLSHSIFKWIKIIAVVVSAILAVQRVRQARPYCRDFDAGDWRAEGNEHVATIPRSEHGRGRYPYARPLVPTERGEFAECGADAIVDANGDVSVRHAMPFRLRIEVRK